jgi:hypothetical protein
VVGETNKVVRVYVYTALSPHSEGDDDGRLKKWTGRNCLTLGDLDRERIAGCCVALRSRQGPAVVLN